MVTRGIKFKKYEPGMTSAHNYPNKALPKSLCCSVPDGILVYPYTAIPSGDLQSLSRSAAKAISINGVPTCRHWPVQLKDRMLERTTILFIFSGDSTDSDSSAVIRWKHTLDDEGSMPNVQYCFLCAQKSYLWNDWFVRNGMQYMAPRFSSIGNFLGYSGRITFKMINALHLYHRELITVLIIDPLCNIRWHCVGNPTAAAIQSLRDAATCITAENVYSSTRKINITARFQRT
ncbi:hypothetical protein IE077_003318 [Cardiosporidium cionae]|uniref:Uncharacterized protein n=1 Tax=Cardiosporidium cionae TaxID=476202 RepID=A0ABQ7J8H7_9APIC|nr:hypothetical protein IE077_003318 [Cardiosporidium cionae]|eukprot:KAF8820299.1 hypothetical protein IE077_003318 [Cardiosporidium cionae]